MNGIHRLDGDEIKNVSAAQTGVILLDAISPSAGTGKNYAEGEFAKIIPVTSTSPELISEENNREFESASGVDWVLWNPEYDSDPSNVVIEVDDADGSGVANKLQVTTTTRSDPQGAALSYIHISHGIGGLITGESYAVSVSLQLIDEDPNATATIQVALGNETGPNITVTTTETVFDHNDFGYHLVDEPSWSLLIQHSSSSAIVFTIDNVSVKQIITPEVSAKTIIGSDLTSSGQFSIIDSKPIKLRDGMLRDDVIVEDHHDRNAVYGTFDKVLVDTGRVLVVPTTKYPVPRLTTINNQYSAQFDGVDDYIDAGNMGINGNVTISAWFKMNAFPTSGYKLNIASQGTTSFGVWNTGLQTQLEWRGRGSSSYSVSGQTALAIDTWYFCAVSQIGTSAGQTTLYLNGIQDDDGSDDSARMTDGHFTIGAHDADPTPTSNTYFNGKIDEVSVWTRGFSKAEIGYYLCDYNYDTRGGIRPMDLSLHDTFADDCELWMRMGD